MVLVAAGVGVLHLQGVVGFLHKKEEVVALQKAVLEQQEQVEQPAQAVVLGLGVLMLQEGASLKQSESGAPFLSSFLPSPQTMFRLVRVLVHCTLQQNES